MRHIFISGTAMVSAEQLARFHGMVADGRINGVMFERFLRGQNPFEELVDIKWEKTFRLLGFGMNDALFFNPIGEGWVIPVPAGVSLFHLLDRMVEFGIPIDFDRSHPQLQVHNLRGSNDNQSYQVLVRRTIEPDADCVGWTAERVQKGGLNGINLFERLMLGAGYFVTTGHHLDRCGSTICAGSRFKSGQVPVVRFDSDHTKHVCIGWTEFNQAYPHCGTRIVM